MGKRRRRTANGIESLMLPRSGPAELRVEELSSLPPSAAVLEGFPLYFPHPLLACVAISHREAREGKGKCTVSRD